MRFAIKKELMYFARTARMFGVIFGIMIFSVADPLMMKGAQLMMKVAGEMAANMNTAVYQETAASGSGDAVFSMLDNISAETVAAGAVGDFCTTASLIVLLVLMQPSGGEQKKRSVIIPQCAGLTPTQYIAPKFIIYPVTAFLSAFVALPVCGLLSSLMFEGSISFASSVASGAVVGLYIAFLIAAELALGICTGKPGVSAITVLLAGNLLPTILALFRVDRFNPFTLPGIAAGLVMGADSDAADIAVSIGVSAVLAVIMYFLTIFVLNAKKVENEGSGPVL